MSKTKQEDELFVALKELYKSETYSDLTVISGDKQYRVHRAIVCPRSAFFAAACSGQFEEANTRTISLPDDDPQAVDMMMHYFYHLDYPHVPLHDESPEGKQLVWEAWPKTSSSQQYTNDSDYDADDFRWSRGIHKAPTNWRQRQALKKQSRACDAEKTVCNLIIHANVYALAEKYNVVGLRLLSLEKFKNEAKIHWDTDDFLQAAVLVYTSTAENVTGMRKVVVQTFSEHNSLFLKDEAMKTVKETENLAYDLLMRIKRPMTESESAY